MYDEQAKEKASKKIKVLESARVSRVHSNFGTTFTGYHKSVSKPMEKIMKDSRKSQAGWQKSQPLIKIKTTIIRKQTTIKPKQTTLLSQPTIKRSILPPKYTMKFPKPLSFPTKPTIKVGPPSSLPKSSLKPPLNPLKLNKK